MAFSAPESFLRGLDAPAVAALIAAASDIALIIDGEGVVRDCYSDVSLPTEWCGVPFIDCVTADSRAKVTDLLAQKAGSAKRWRQVNHPGTDGDDLPVQYNVVVLGQSGTRVVFGRDQSGLVAAQQELLEAQQSLERQYWKVRQFESRYLLLLQFVTDVVLIVDGRSGDICEANAPALELLGKRGRLGRPIGACFEDPDGLTELFDSARYSGGRETRILKPAAELAADAGQDLGVTVLPFKQEDALYYFVRLGAVDGGSLATDGGVDTRLLAVARSTSDGILVTDERGRVVAANQGFLDLVGATHEAQVVGESLETWVGRTGVEHTMLISTLRQGDLLRAFATVLRDVRGGTHDVELSGAVLEGETLRFGWILRDVGRRAAAANGTQMPVDAASVEQLKDLVGKVPMKELIRESSDMIEKLCIEAALELTGNNRASAAELLGLSRQSLYVKLRRYGLSSDSG